MENFNRNFAAGSIATSSNESNTFLAHTAKSDVPDISLHSVRGSFSNSVHHRTDILILSLLLIAFVVVAVVVIYFIRSHATTPSHSFPRHVELCFKDGPTMALFLTSLNTDYPQTPVYIPLIYVDQLNNDDDGGGGGSGGEQELPTKTMTVPVYKSYLTKSTAAAEGGDGKSPVTVVFEFYKSIKIHVESPPNLDKPKSPLVFNYQTGEFVDQNNDDRKLFVRVNTSGVEINENDNDNRVAVKVNFPVHLDYTNRLIELCAELQANPSTADKFVYTLLPYSMNATKDRVVELANEDLKLKNAPDQIVNIPDRKYKYDSFGVCRNTSTTIGTFEENRCGTDPHTNRTKVYAGGGTCVPLDDVSYKCLTKFNTLVNTTTDAKSVTDTYNVLIPNSNSSYAACKISSNSMPLYDKANVQTCPKKTPIFDVETQRCIPDANLNTLCRTMHVNDGNYILPSVMATVYDPKQTYLNCKNGIANFVTCDNPNEPLRPKARNACVDYKCRASAEARRLRDADRPNNNNANRNDTTAAAANGQQVKLADAILQHNADKYTFVISESMMTDQPESWKNAQVNMPHFLTDYVYAISYCQDGVFGNTAAEFKDNTSFEYRKEYVFKQSKFPPPTKTAIQQFENINDVHIKYALPPYVFSRFKMHVESDNNTINVKRHWLKTFRDVPDEYVDKKNRFIRVITNDTKIGSERGFLYFSLYIDIDVNKNRSESDDLIIDQLDASPKVLSTLEEENLAAMLATRFTHIYASSWLLKQSLWVYDPKTTTFKIVNNAGYPLLKAPFGFMSSALAKKPITNTSLVNNKSSGDNEPYHVKIADSFVVVVKTINIVEFNTNKAVETGVVDSAANVDSSLQFASWWMTTAPRINNDGTNEQLYDKYGYMIDDVVLRLTPGLPRIEPAEEACKIPGAQFIIGSTYYKTKSGTSICGATGQILSMLEYPCVTALHFHFKHIKQDDGVFKNSCSEMKNPTWWDVHKKEVVIKNNIGGTLDVVVKGVNTIQPYNRTIVTKKVYDKYKDILAANGAEHFFLTDPLLSSS